MSSLNWEDLRFFLALARAGTLSRAAKQLGVKHTTVSRRVSALEEDAGVRLFDRFPRGYVLTPAGERVLEIAMGVDEQMLALDRQILGQDTELTGALRITTLDIISMHYMNAFESFRRRYRDVDMELLVDNELRSITKREADLAIRATDCPPEHLFGRHLVRWEFAVYGSVELIGDEPQRGLHDYPWIGFEEREENNFADKWMRNHFPGAHIAIRVNSAMVMFAAAQKGLGLAILPTSVASNYSDLRCLSDAVPEFSTDFWILTHPDLCRTARVKAFIEHMVGVMAS